MKNILLYCIERLWHQCSMSLGYSIVICTQEEETFNGDALCNIGDENEKTLDSFEIVYAGDKMADHSLETSKPFRFLHHN